MLSSAKKNIMSKKSKNYKEKQLNNLLGNLSAFTPFNDHRFIFINGYTRSIELFHLIQFARETNEFTIDTENDYSTNKPALIQIEFIHDESVVLLVEMNHLPHEKSSLFWQIKALFKVIFDSKNKIFSWGNIKDELSKFTLFHLFESNAIDKIQNIDVQVNFKTWHQYHVEWVRQHLSSLSSSVSSPIINELETWSNRGIKEKNFTWALQKAIALVFVEFHDKSNRNKNWGRCLDLKNSYIPWSKTPEEKADVDAMIKYAIDDCLAVTKLVTVLDLDWQNQISKKKEIFYFIGDDDDDDNNKDWNDDIFG